ncbi:NAD+ synthase [Pleionea sediminis]|uniref:NAD+ synthase n=1 Tax=Pleionea sediminis TaxID=2569479 RepID=UPI0011850B9F|nr:NAD+ synthase [Pleionea sediminis]
MKIAMAQLNYKVGDVTGNLKKILTAYQMCGDDVDIMVCSELALTGYYPQDLLKRDSLIIAQDKALNELAAHTRNRNTAIVIGCARKNLEQTGRPLHNALLLLANGEALFEYHKRLLPTYNVFDEARHFEPGSNSNVFEFKGHTLGFLICEDAWPDAEGYRYENTPVDDISEHRVDCVISINASPSNINKLNERFFIGKQVVEKTQAAFIYLNQVGGNDELVFDGGSFILDKVGTKIHQSVQFDQAVDFIEVDLEQNNTQPNRNKVTEEVTPSYSSNHSHSEFYWRQTVLGIRDYINKCGFSKVVIGSSGGIDSAVTLAICTEALGAEGVTAITMPSKFSSQGSVTDSEVLCKNLDVRLYEAPIKEEYDVAVRAFQTMSGEFPSQLTCENIQARIRGRKLMEYSNHFGALVVSTGNKSEMSVGYATLYGDMNGGINPLGDLYKMDVYALANYVNEFYDKEIIPRSIIDKPPSAELAEDQKDTDSLPDYPLLDAVLKLYIEGDLLERAEYEACQKIISAASLAEKEVERIHQMVNRAEFKRRQAPPIIRVQRRSFGMGRWLPVAANYQF